MVSSLPEARMLSSFLPLVGLTPMSVMEEMGLRKGDLTNMVPDGKGRVDRKSVV